MLNRKLKDAYRNKDVRRSEQFANFIRWNEKF